MQASILERLEQERGLAFSGPWSQNSVYGWFPFLGFYGAMAPDMAELWSKWWALTNRGLAVAALQYLSCLMYPDDANPVFAAWTALEGGGPPELWENGSSNFETCWLPENIAFLRQVLTVEYLREKLENAAERLEGEAEWIQAKRMLDDFAEWAWLVKSRSSELPDLLAVPTHAMKWSL